MNNCFGCPNLCILDQKQKELVMQTAQVTCGFQTCKLVNILTSYFRNCLLVNILTKRDLSIKHLKLITYLAFKINNCNLSQLF